RLRKREHHSCNRDEHTHEHKRICPAHKRGTLGTSANNGSRGERKAHLIQLRCGVVSALIIHRVPRLGALYRFDQTWQAGYALEIVVGMQRLELLAREGAPHCCYSSYPGCIA